MIIKGSKDRPPSGTRKTLSKIEIGLWRNLNKSFIKTKWVEKFRTRYGGLETNANDHLKLSEVYIISLEFTRIKRD